MCVGETEVVQGAVRTVQGVLSVRWAAPAPAPCVFSTIRGPHWVFLPLRLEVVEAVTLTKHRWGSFVDQSQNGPVSAR